MLQHGQLIRVVADFVQQASHQARRYLAAADGDRAGDREPQLVAGHPGHQYCPSFTVSARPGISAHDPMNSDRIVNTT